MDYVAIDKKLIEEGKAKLLIPNTEKISSYLPFYNPIMKINRDFTIAIINLFSIKNFIDGLCGCGALSVRALKETQAQIYANENNPITYKFLEENVKINANNNKNETSKIKIFNSDLNALLYFLKNSKIDFDFIDIDPFGSPVDFITNALNVSKHNTIISVTATDLGTLCGRYPKTCLRRYGIFSAATDFDKELGLRNLIGYIAKEAAKFEIGIEILFSYYYRHYFKVYFRIKKLRSFADETLKNVKFLLYCNKCYNRKYIKNFDELNNLNCECSTNGDNKFKILGPLWSGKFADKNVCNLLKDELSKKLMDEHNKSDKETQKEIKILEIVSKEQDINLPYYDIHKFCKINRIKVPKKEEILRNCNSYETHFVGTGIRFNGSVKEFAKILEQITNK